MKIIAYNPKFMGSVESSAQRVFYSCKCLFLKEKRSQINKLTFLIELLDKEEQTKPKVNRDKAIIKIRTKINKIEKQRKINETHIWFSVKINAANKPE